MKLSISYEQDTDLYEVNVEEEGLGRRTGPLFIDRAHVEHLIHALEAISNHDAGCPFSLALDTTNEVPFRAPGVYVADDQDD